MASAESADHGRNRPHYKYDMGWSSKSSLQALPFVESAMNGNLAESIKRSASDQLGESEPKVQAHPFPGFFTTFGVKVRYFFPKEANSKRINPTKKQFLNTLLQREHIMAVT